MRPQPPQPKHSFSGHAEIEGYTLSQSVLGEVALSVEVEFRKLLKHKQEPMSEINKDNSAADRGFSWKEKTIHYF